MTWRRFFRLFAVILFLGAGACASFAQELAATTNLNVRSGPGTEYPIVGQLRPNEIVSELRCNSARTWCEIQSRQRSLRGWAARSYLQLVGQTQPPVQRPVPVTPRPGFTLPPEARVCFYDQPNFRGREMCSGRGDAYPTLNSSWDNQIRSVEVEGDLRATICTEPGLRGTCAILDRSIGDLGSLAGQISSYRVD